MDAEFEAENPNSDAELDSIENEALENAGQSVFSTMSFFYVSYCKAMRGDSKKLYTFPNSRKMLLYQSKADIDVENLLGKIIQHKD